jgi:hypothetical protein
VGRVVVIVMLRNEVDTPLFAGAKIAPRRERLFTSVAPAPRRALEARLRLALPAGLKGSERESNEIAEAGEVHLA